MKYAFIISALVLSCPSAHADNDTLLGAALITGALYANAQPVSTISSKELKRQSVELDARFRAIKNFKLQTMAERAEAEQKNEVKNVSPISKTGSENIIVNGVEYAPVAKSANITSDKFKCEGLSNDIPFTEEELTPLVPAKQTTR